jgi:hypothetical protein
VTLAPPVLHTISLTVRPWADQVIDRLGVDPRSAYVERFWLPVLGPSAIWLLRLIAERFDTDPGGFELAVEETARSIGLGGRGRNSPFARTLVRCCQFRIAHLDERDGVLLVRPKLPPLNRHQLSRLPATRRAEHDAWPPARHAPLPATDPVERDQRPGVASDASGAEPRARTVLP